MTSFNKQIEQNNEKINQLMKENDEIRKILEEYGNSKRYSIGDVIGFFAHGKKHEVMLVNCDGSVYAVDFYSGNYWWFGIKVKNVDGENINGFGYDTLRKVLGPNATDILLLINQRLGD